MYICQIYITNINSIKSSTSTISSIVHQLVLPHIRQMYGCVVSNSTHRPEHIPTMQLHTPVRSTVESILSALDDNIPSDPYFIHLPYNLVVGRPNESYISRTTSFIQDLAAEVRSDTKMIIHFGSSHNGGSLSNVINFCSGFDDLERRQLLLENMAGTGKIMGSSLCDLKVVYSQVPMSIGFCLDTQHSFAASMIDWREVTQVKKSLNEVSEVTGGIDLIHFNDSKVGYGSCRDSHERLGRGEIWGGNYRNLIKIIREIHDRQIALVPETSDSIADSEYIGKVISKYESRKRKDKS